MVQQVLHLPELRIAKHCDTQWLAHERCVKAVKASYGAIVTALNDIHQNTHEPEALASVERSFSQMKLIKTRLRSSLNDKSLSHLMKIA